MSEVGDSARVTMIVADYAAVNEGNNSKFTVVGSGISLVGFNSQASSRTPPLSIVAVVTFDSKFIGESPIVELTLETADGVIVEVPPGTDAPAGAIPQPLHIQTGPGPLVPTVIPGFQVPVDAVRPKVQMMMQFPSGLPLSVDQKYLWRVTVDGETRDEWTEGLYVLDLSQGTQAN